MWGCPNQTLFFSSPAPDTWCLSLDSLWVSVHTSRYWGRSGRFSNWVGPQPASPFGSLENFAKTVSCSTFLEIRIQWVWIGNLSLKTCAPTSFLLARRAPVWGVNLVVFRPNCGPGKRGGFSDLQAGKGRGHPPQNRGASGCWPRSFEHPVLVRLWGGLKGSRPCGEGHPPPRPSDHGLPRPRRLGRVWGRWPGGRGRGLSAAAREGGREVAASARPPSPNLRTGRLGDARVAGGQGRQGWPGWPRGWRGGNHGSSREVPPAAARCLPESGSWGSTSVVRRWLSLSPQDLQECKTLSSRDTEMSQGPWVYRWGTAVSIYCDVKNFLKGWLAVNPLLVSKIPLSEMHSFKYCSLLKALGSSNALEFKLYRVNQWLHLSFIPGKRKVSPEYWRNKEAWRLINWSWVIRPQGPGHFLGRSQNQLCGRKRSPIPTPWMFERGIMRCQPRGISSVLCLIITVFVKEEAPVPRLS